MQPSIATQIMPFMGESYHKPLDLVRGFEYDGRTEETACFLNSDSTRSDRANVTSG